MKFEEFAKLIKKGDFLAYAIILSLHMTCLLKADESLTISLLYQKQKKVFLEKKGNELLSLEGCQHAIELELSAKLLYSPIYNLFKKELEIL